MIVAFVTGASGQDGSYLLELLLAKGYIVHGMVRRNSTSITERIHHLMDNPKLHLHYGDMTDMSSLTNILKTIRDQYWREDKGTTAGTNTSRYIEIYNLAAQSHVKVSFETPIYTAQADAVGVLNLLEAIRTLDMLDKVRVYQASTSEMFGASPPPQNETTPFHPRSPYGVAKLYAHWIIKNYRESYNMWCCSGLLFNHESPRRGMTFVTRKITMAVAQRAKSAGPAGPAGPAVLELGNLNARRDWGHARDYVYAMWLMLQQDVPRDFVISTGKSYSVRDFVEIAFGCIGVNIRWIGTGLDEKGYDAESGALLVKVNPKFYRPAEVDDLLGDSSQAAECLNWVPTLDIKDLVREMVDNDIKRCT